MFELRREVFHILSGIGFLLVLIFVPYSKYILFAIFVIGMLISMISAYIPIPVVSNFLCLFERRCNRSFPGKGVIMFFLGSLLSIQLFEENIAIVSILILTFSDPISHLVGSTFGKTKIVSKRKNIEGTVAGIAVGTALGSFLIPVWLAFIASLSAMIIELLELKVEGHIIDDNLLIPLTAGTILHFMSKLIM